MNAEDTFRHIAKFWNEYNYIGEKERWENALKDVSSEGDFVCLGCGARWKQNDHICSSERICGLCDTYCQPYLSNPLVKEYVLKYIPEKYHHYIFLKKDWKVITSDGQEVVLPAHLRQHCKVGTERLSVSKEELLQAVSRYPNVTCEYEDLKVLWELGANSIILSYRGKIKPRSKIIPFVNTVDSLLHGIVFQKGVAYLGGQKAAWRMREYVRVAPYVKFSVVVGELLRSGTKVILTDHCSAPLENTEGEIHLLSHPTPFVLLCCQMSCEKVILHSPRLSPFCIEADVDNGTQLLSHKAFSLKLTGKKEELSLRKMGLRVVEVKCQDGSLWLQCPRTWRDPSLKLTVAEAERILSSENLEEARKNSSWLHSWLVHYIDWPFDTLSKVLRGENVPQFDVRREKGKIYIFGKKTFRIEGEKVFLYNRSLPHSWHYLTKNLTIWSRHQEDDDPTFCGTVYSTLSSTGYLFAKKFVFVGELYLTPSVLNFKWERTSEGLLRKCFF